MNLILLFIVGFIFGGMTMFGAAWWLETRYRIRMNARARERHQRHEQAMWLTRRDGINYGDAMDIIDRYHTN